MCILRIENVSKYINDEKILLNINLKVKSNTIFGLVGCNGAGKSTLLKMVLGVYNTNNGEIYIDNYSIKKDVEKALKNVGAVVDTPSLYNYLSGRRNLEFFNLLGKNLSKRNLGEVVKLLKMEKYIDKPVSTYSLGMRQRLALGIALISNPKLLILDEPINGLDPVGIKELRNILLYLKSKYNMAIIISSHILSELENICDKVAIIKDHKIHKIIDIKKEGSSLENIFFEERECQS